MKVSGLVAGNGRWLVAWFDVETAETKQTPTVRLKAAKVNLSGSPTRLGLIRPFSATHKAVQDGYWLPRLTLVPTQPLGER